MEDYGDVYGDVERSYDDELDTGGLAFRQVPICALSSLLLPSVYEVGLQ